MLALYRQHLNDGRLATRVSGAGHEDCRHLPDRSEVAPKRRKVFMENPDHFKGNCEETEVLLEF